MIAGLSERSRLVSAIGDIVYINQGSNDGVKLGTEFDVVRAIGRVKSPSTHDVLGTHVSQLGRVRVVAVEPQTATVEIVASCLDIHPNDRLVAAHDPEPILGFNPGPPARHGAAPSGKASGEVVVSPNLLHSVGQGHIVQIDLGEGEGVQRGTRVSLFSSNDAGSSYERNMLGSGVVITVHGNTSAVKILDSYREIYIGDRVELQ